MKKIYLLAAVILLMGAAAGAEEKSGSAVLKKVSSKEGAKIIDENKGKAEFVILDVRTDDEFKSGHIEKAVQLDFYLKDFESKLNALDKNKTYVVYCRSGNRSGQAFKMMEKLGFKKVYDIGGVGDWTNAGFKLVK